MRGKDSATASCAWTRGGRKHEYNMEDRFTHIPLHLFSGARGRCSRQVRGVVEWGSSSASLWPAGLYI